MQFINLTKQQLRIRKKIEIRIKNVLDSGKYILGPEIVNLEEKLAEYVGIKHCITCSSGTDALLMPLWPRILGLVMQYLPPHLPLLLRLKLYDFLAQPLSL